VYEAKLPAPADDFEYFIEAKTADSTTLRWPPTAPRLSQTVVVAK
jgi:hypothetical protein